MSRSSVKTFGDLRKLRLNADAVQITKCGGMFKARYRGHANCVIGETADQAKQRLLSDVAKKRGILSANPNADFLAACR